ncbi:MAG: PTS system mannose/fructose/sorbose family transporter subunit IID [Desulfovibrio sp.]|nr:PTS system mannose/fructose/sorbose family transporter subunit IID [Desulfovibrio sp.]
MYPTRVALACLARTAFINAAVTTRGMQQIGMALILEPGLRHLFPDPAARAEAFGRYAGHSNTHPFLAPLYVGILLALEEHVANGSLPQTAISSVRETLGTTLSALGDALFSGTLLPLWALVSVNFILSDMPVAALVLTATLCVTQLLFRAYSFFYGLRCGMTALVRLRQMDGINWADRLKIVNALLTALTIWRLPCSVLQPLPWAGCFLGIAALFIAAWMIVKLHLPRLLLWCATFCAILMDLG